MWKKPVMSTKLFFISMKSLYCHIRAHGARLLIIGALVVACPQLGGAESLAPSTSNSAPTTIKAHPFGKKRPKPQGDISLQQKINRVVSIQQKNIDVEAPVTFSGRPHDPPQDTDLSPRRTTFPGKSDTLSQMDEETPSQLNVYYKLDERATAHVAVNEQDMDSPTYTPIKRDEGLNAAGMYLNLGVNENVKVKVGGEVRSHETSSHDPSDKSSAGARVGLQWNF